MAVEWRARRIAYFPSPKVACTTLKLLFYRLSEGRDFTADGHDDDAIHLLAYGTQPFSKSRPELYGGWRKICVVRDPIERFFSAYANRVLEFDELGAGAEDFVRRALAVLELPERPSLSFFIRHMDQYLGASGNIAHHFAPQSLFLGPDLGFYTNVYPLSQISEVAEFLSNEAGVPLQLPISNKSRASVGYGDVSVDDLERLVDFYAGDYALLRRFFRAEDALRKVWGPKQPKKAVNEILHRYARFSGTIHSSTYLPSGAAVWRGGETQVPIRLRVGKIASVRPETEIRGFYFLSVEIDASDHFSPGGSYNIICGVETSDRARIGFILRSCSVGENVDIGGTKQEVEPGRTEFNIGMYLDVSPSKDARLQFIAFVSGECLRFLRVFKLEIQQRDADLLFRDRARPAPCAAGR